MRFRYSTTGPSQREADSLPRVSLVLRNRSRAVEAIVLVDSGAMVNVLPYDLGLRLGLIWNDRKATIPLSGALGNLPAIPTVAIAEIEGLPPVRLAFGWINRDDVPLIFGQTNFFMEFDIHFFRSRLEFEITPKSA